MTRTEQECLVERYLNGEMNSAAEQEFFIQVAVDSNLRQTLKAYRIVESALRKHRDAVPSQHAEARSRMVSLLQAASVAHPGFSGVTPAGGASAEPNRGDRTRLGSAAFRWIFMAVIAIGFTVAGFLVTSDTDIASGVNAPSSDAPTKMTGTAGAQRAPAAEALSPSLSQPEQTANASVQQDRQAVASDDLQQNSRGKAASTPAALARQSQMRKTAAQQPAGTSPSQETSQSAADDRTSAAQEPALSPASSTQPDEPALQRNGRDTLNMRMQLTPPHPRR